MKIEFFSFGLLRNVLPSLAAVILAIGCSKNQPDPRLIAAEAHIYEDPKAAIEELERMNPEEYDKADRRLYDLLMIKAADKAYVRHTSDSLILQTIDYFKSHGPKGRYSEALYYGGRVYSDMGDAPSALDYFHRSLENLPEDSINSDFEGNVVSQMGRLLGDLKIYSEALKYLEKCLEIDISRKDSANLFYDYKILGEIYMLLKDSCQAKSYFKETIKFEPYASLSDRALIDIYLLKMQTDEIPLDSAKEIINRANPVIAPMSKGTALLYTAYIYRDYDLTDSSYTCLKKIIDSDDPTQKYYAYFTLLSDDYMPYIEKDSLLPFIEGFKEHGRDMLNENNTRMVLNQQAYYNYRLQEQQRRKAEKEKVVIMARAAVLFFLCLVITIIFITVKYRDKKRILQLTEALNHISRLRKNIESEEGNEERTDDTVNVSLSAESLREKLRDELLGLSQQKPKAAVSEALLSSAPYERLQGYLNEGKIILDTDPVWEELEREVLKVYPNFRNNFNLLSRGLHTDLDYKTALLVKYGINQQTMTRLLGRAKNTIATRKNNLSLRLLDQKINNKVVDNILRLL